MMETAIHDLLRLAEKHHRSGRLPEAATLCRQALQRQPDHPDVLHLLGIITAQSGQLEAGAELIRRSLKLRPQFAQAWENLGRILVNQQNPQEAIGAYQRVTALRPDDAAAHYALGILLKDAGQPQEAIASFSRAAELKDDPETFFQLGKALRSQNRNDEAIAAYSRAISLNPRFADACNNLGNALRDKGLLYEAIEQYIKAIELKRDDPIAHFNLGNAYSENEDYSQAVAAYRQALKLSPDHAEAHSQLGAALGRLEQFSEAMSCHRRALSLDPNSARAHEALGATLVLKQEMLAAIDSFRRALELDPNLAGAWNGLGAASLALGRLDDAAEFFRRAMELSQNEVLFQKNLISLLSSDNADPAKISQLAELLDREGLPIQQRIGAAFGLGKMLDDADRFDEAFARYAQGNNLFREWRAQAGERFDHDALSRRIDATIETYIPDFFSGKSGRGNDSRLPVFIVGMPRSGTTLVEQICASHPAVFGAGELPDITRLSAALARTGATPADGWEPHRIAQAAEAYLDHLRLLGPSARRITDKMPGNVYHLGLIAVLFPRARVILCRRDPRDTCLSCYFQWFPSSRLLYTCDLADCARQYLQTERLVSHWRKVLPVPMLEMQYEELVANQEAQSRRLIEFLGLPWDPACLEFHKTRRTVTTASVWQVRQPMYNRSVGRWRNYERHLGPLVHVLEEKTS